MYRIKKVLLLLFIMAVFFENCVSHNKAEESLKQPILFELQLVDSSQLSLLLKPSPSGNVEVLKRMFYNLRISNLTLDSLYVAVYHDTLTGTITYFPDIGQLFDEKGKSLSIVTLFTYSNLLIKIEKGETKNFLTRIDFPRDEGHYCELHYDIYTRYDRESRIGLRYYVRKKSGYFLLPDSLVLLNK